MSVIAEGPYLLGGRCFGGLVAFEMAQQLNRQGEKTALLVILDTRLIHNVHFEEEILPRVPQPQGKKARNGTERVRDGDANFSGPVVARLRSLIRTHERARRRYVPKIYSGRITLFRK